MPRRAAHLYSARTIKDDTHEPQFPADDSRLTRVPRRPIFVEFLKFGTVGGIGFVLDTATVYALRGSLGLYGAGVVAYVVAASSNWLLNRLWTFRGRGDMAAHRQWALFLLANLVGFVLNRGTYAVLVTFIPLCAEQPVLAVAGGTLAGLWTNFLLSRALVFR